MLLEKQLNKRTLSVQLFWSVQVQYIRHPEKFLTAVWLDPPPFIALTVEQKYVSQPY